MNKRMLMRRINPLPFVPSDPAQLTYHCRRTLDIQKLGLVGRLRSVYAATKSQKVIVNLSGGRDSVLAFLVTVLAYDYLGWDRANILAVSLPAWGTDDATHEISLQLPIVMKTGFWESEVVTAAEAIIRATGHEPCHNCLTCENGLARARTNVGMTLGFLVGTGDMSEGFKGWCTFGGDQISMYNPNASVPKTLVSFLLRQIVTDNLLGAAANVQINNTLAQEITPGLIEIQTEIIQKTEDIIGPYELTDKFMEAIVRNLHSPKKVFYLACLAFEDKYDLETVYKWLEDGYRRTYGSQFKRQAVPDTAKVGFSLDPRGDYRMPSDAPLPTSLRRELAELKALIAS